MKFSERWMQALSVVTSLDYLWECCMGGKTSKTEKIKKSAFVSFQFWLLINSLPSSSDFCGLTPFTALDNDKFMKYLNAKRSSVRDCEASLEVIYRHQSEQSSVESNAILYKYKNDGLTMKKTKNIKFKKCIRCSN